MINRNGSYKKILIDSETLKIHGEYLRTNLKSLNQMELSPQNFTTLYLLLFLRIKHPENWMQKNSKNLITPGLKIDADEDLMRLIPETFALNEWEKEKLKGLGASGLFMNFNLKAIPESINRTMLQWISGNWNIEMLHHIPNSRELLRLQVKNTRCITVIIDPKKIDSLVLNTRDPLSFVLHDLMHADQFFSQKESLKGQLGFYKLINDIYEKSELRYLLKNNIEFKKEFEYIASDMNAYVIHLFKCLKSSVERTEQKEIFFDLILSWWNMSDEEKKSSRMLNTPSFNQNDENILKNFFEKNQEILNESN